MSANHQDRSDCTHPPALDDLDLIAAFDDELSLDVRTHLQECPACTRRANDLAMIQRSLQQRFYRMFCPSSTDLLCFQQRMLNPERYIAIAEHLRDCPHCTGELHLIEQAAGTSILSVGGFFPSQRIALKLEKHGLFPVATSAPHSHTYGSLGDQYLYRADRIRLMLSVERTFGRPSRCIVTGRLSVGNSSANQLGSTASLLSGEQILSSSSIDTLGCFTIEDVPSGELTLSLRLQDCEVVIDSLRV